MKPRVVSLSTVVFAVFAAGCSGGHTPAMLRAQQAMPRSVSPALVKPAPMAQTPIQPSSAMRSPRKTAVGIQGTNWTQIPGSATAVAAAPDGSLWVLSDQPAGADKYIWHYASGAWTNISGLADQLAVAPNGTLYALNSGGGTYSYSSGTWTALGGGAKAISVASDGSVYVISNAGSGDQAIWHNAAGTWTQVPGAGTALASSWDTNTYTLSNGTVSPGGTYVLNAQGEIWYQNPNQTYVQLAGAASAIAPTKSGGAFVLGYPSASGGEAIYYYNLDTPGWSTEAGSGVSLSTDNSTLYVVGASGAIYSSPITPLATPSPSPSPSPTPPSEPPPQLTDYSIASVGAETDPEGIVSGPNNSLWFVERQGYVDSFSTSGVQGVSYTTQCSGCALGGYPKYLAVGSDGNLWYAQTIANSSPPWTGAVGKISPDGTIQQDYALSGASTSGIVAGPDGNLWVALQGDYTVNGVAKMTTDGVANYYNTGGSSNGITIGPDGNIWSTSIIFSQGVAVVTTPSGSSTVYDFGFSSYPEGITAGPDGNIWFADQDANAIVKMSVSGIVLAKYAIPTAVSGPFMITAGPDGNLWFTEQTAGQIGRITTSGYVSEYKLPTASMMPNFITSGPDGNIWFTELYNGSGYGPGRIGKIVP